VHADAFIPQGLPNQCVSAPGGKKADAGEIAVVDKLS